MNDQTILRGVHPAVYFAVWTALAIGTFILFRVRRGPEFRTRWHARITLITGVLIATLMFLVAPHWIVLVMVVGFGGFITYLNITKITICAKCGKIVQPGGFFTAAKFCPRCGGDTVRSKILT